MKASAPVINESAFTRLRVLELRENPVIGKLDAAYLKEINRRILQDMPMYNGGQLRLSMGEHLRSRSVQNGQDSYVVHYKHGGITDDAINDAIKKVGSVEQLKKLPKKEFCEQLASLYGDLDHIHAFNEANSRTLRLFTELIANAAGFSMDWTELDTISLKHDFSVRDTLYMARDLEVSKRSFPRLTIDKMRDASPSEFEAYETQKKLNNILSMANLIQAIVD